MDYKHFVITPFEREPGRWRADIRRADERPVTCEKKTFPFFVTSHDTATADEAVALARAAIDGGFVS
jgi:hypothetical protein